MGNHHSGMAAFELVNHEPSQSEDKRNAARQQLEALLADPLFKHSKRCSDFLRFTVSRSLDQTTDAIKERTLGVELFGRQPDYDTAADPVVRVTATEVRKRLHHYYQTFGRDSEIRIELAKGSYVPEFSVPQNRTVHGRAGTANDRAQSPFKTRSLKRWLVAIIVAAPYIALCVFLLGATRENNLERFWSPITSTKQSITFCVPSRDLLGASETPAPTELAAIQKALLVMGRPSHVALSDAIALSTISRSLRNPTSRFEFRESKDAKLEDLRAGPIILIGGFSNRWTQQFQGGRFSFSHDNSFHYIADKQSPSSRSWALDDNDPNAAVDYGLISRMLNPTTGTYFVTVAGIHGFGTEAAAECATDDACLGAAARLAPGNWKKANVQIVIRAAVIDRSPGMPKVVAATLW